MAAIIDDTMDFTLYMKETEEKTKVKSSRLYLGQLKDSLRLKQLVKQIFLPWQKTQESFSFRKGEVTLWSGQNGHGKSMLVTEVAISLMAQGEKVCIASFEMKPYVTLQRMCRMWIGLNPYTPEFQEEEGMKSLDTLYDQFGAWTDEKLWLYDQMGTADYRVVAAMCRYCAKDLKITHIIIDNLAKCMETEDDYNGQKAFVNELTAIARDYDIHIHLVHHLKKPQNENAIPDKHDNKGSGSVTDQVDNVMLVWRNKAKEDDIRNAGKFAKSANDPDALLLCRKQRNYEGSGEGEPTIKLWFHRDSQQYLGDPSLIPMQMWSWPHVY